MVIVVWAVMGRFGMVSSNMVIIDSITVVLWVAGFIIFLPPG